MNKELLIKLAAVAVILGGLVFFDYSVSKVMKKFPCKKTTEQPTDTLPAIEKTDTTIVLSSKDKARRDWFRIIHYGQ